MSQTCPYKQEIEGVCFHLEEGKCSRRQVIMIHGTSDCIEHQETFLSMDECRKQMHELVDTLFNEVDEEQFDEVGYYIEQIKGLVKHIEHRQDEIGRADYEASLGNHYTN